jgi:acetaldehyde dehydrogenase (acetylating)
MSEFNDLVERYIAVWNEVDPDRRQRLIADTFSDGASYVDPLMASEGHAAIDGMVRAVQARFPGYRFRRAGVVDGHHDRIRFRWELATEGGPVVAKGTDFATVASARMTTVTGFIDQAPA